MIMTWKKLKNCMRFSMTDRPKRPQNFQSFSAEVKYDFNRAELEEIIREHANLPDGVVEWDISNRGQVRGASVKARRVEIKG